MAGALGLRVQGLLGLGLGYWALRLGLIGLSAVWVKRKAGLRCEVTGFPNVLWVFLHHLVGCLPW